MLDVPDLTDLVCQLEESKFIRLFRYLLEPAVTIGGREDRLKRDPIPLDLPDAELQLKILGAVRSMNSWAYAWLFHILHLPSFFCDSDAIEAAIKARLRLALENLKQRPHPLSAFSGAFDPPSRFDPVPEGYDYYLFTNMSLDPDGAVFSRIAEYGHECFSEVLGEPRSKHPRFGVGSPETIMKQSQAEVRDFVVDLLNTPSSYYFIAREGRISVVPVTEHGRFLANSAGKGKETADQGLSAVATSTLTGSDRLIVPSFSELEMLINDRKTQERDLQEFFKQHPHFLYGLDERYSEIRPHVCLYDAKGERLVPDFMARIQDSCIWDIIELKLPQHPLVVNSRGIEGASAAVARGIAELLQYRDFFSVRSHRERVRRRFGTAPYEPCLVLVIGRGRSAEQHEWRSARRGFPRVKIVSYDYLFERARECSILLARHL